MACSRCKYSRWIVAQDKESKQVYGFRCSCPSNLSKTIHEWNDKYAKTYETDFEVKLPVEFKAMAANDKPELDPKPTLAPVDFDECPF
jgi:hypothetical protein